MAVQFRRDEVAPEIEPASDSRDDDDGDSDFGHGLLIAIRSSVLWLIPAAVLLAVALQKMKKPLIAADHLLLHGQGDHWQESLMPAFLFAFCGAIFGALLAWRIGARTSLGNLHICLATGAVSLLLAIVGVVYGATVFEAGMPLMVWLCLAVMLCAAIGGAWGLSHWIG